MQQQQRRREAWAQLASVRVTHAAATAGWVLQHLLGELDLWCLPLGAAAGAVLARLAPRSPHLAVVVLGCTSENGGRAGTWRGEGGPGHAAGLALSLQPDSVLGMHAAVQACASFGGRHALALAAVPHASRVRSAKEALNQGRSTARRAPGLCPPDGAGRCLSSSVSSASSSTSSSSPSSPPRASVQVPPLPLAAAAAPPALAFRAMAALAPVSHDGLAAARPPPGAGAAPGRPLSSSALERSASLVLGCGAGQRVRGTVVSYKVTGGSAGTIAGLALQPRPTERAGERVGNVGHDRACL